jgi:hypothetical protein
MKFGGILLILLSLLLASPVFAEELELKVMESQLNENSITDPSESGIL